MKTTGRFWLTLALAVSFFTGPWVTDGSALQRHPVDSDNETGYWCFDCHKFKENPVNAQWLRTEIALKSSPDSSVTVDYMVPGALVKDTPPYNGPCQVCHTETNHYRSDGTGIDHFVGSNCLACHAHFQKNMFTWTFIGSQSHATHIVDPSTGESDNKGPAIEDCTVCHNANDFSLFGVLGDSLAVTDVCDSCHSPDGAFDGVSDPVVGAKTNWEDGIYRSGGNNLKDGKNNWCATCHDNGVSLIDSVSAPNVMGDNATYGYNISGHGRNPSNQVQCEGCHDLTLVHTDGLERTYKATSDMRKRKYSRAYRLNDSMKIPRYEDGSETSFTLCTNCHPYTEVIDNTKTNFRNIAMPFSYHKLHLDMYPTIRCWDSDWNGKADSIMSCPACHNVHGSPTPAMTRHGELISTPGTTDKVPALDFKWYEKDEVTVTLDVTKSRYGAFISGGMYESGNLAVNNVCWGCHPTYTNKDPKFTLLPSWDQNSFWYERQPTEGSSGTGGEQPSDEKKVEVNEVWTSDLADDRKTTFAVGEALRFHMRFTVTGPDAGYVVKSLKRKSQALNVTGGEWLLKFADDDVLPAGVYEWTWKKAIPAEATTGSEAKVIMQLNMYEADGVNLIGKNTGEYLFYIAP